MFLSRHLGRAHERWRDPILTILTALLVLIMFVIAPLHTANVIDARPLNVAAILVMTAGLLVVSRSLAPVMKIGRAHV